jgi:hypothetical protein
VDNPRFQPAEARFVPDRRFTALAAAGAVVAAVAVLLSDDNPSRLIGVLAFVVLLAYVIGDLVFSPRLVASTDGLVILSPLTRATLPWSEIEAVRADTRVHYGLRSTTLEIDAGAVLAIFSRRALGADPAEVADLVSAFRPS